jgi:ribosome-associated toxin RatA of RatAB toxin-antitoxin module
VTTDRSTADTVVDAPPERVLAVLRDVERQPDWLPQITAAELLEQNEDGTPATAAFRLSTPVGSDQFTVRYQHEPDAMSWSLVSSSGLQSGQNGRFEVADAGGGRTRVTFTLEMEHSIRAPGFLRQSVFDSFVTGALAGLRAYLAEVS